MSSSRVFLGRIPRTSNTTEILNHLEDFIVQWGGYITDARLVGPFGYVEFDSEDTAKRVVQEFSNRPLLGENIVVEYLKTTRRPSIRAPELGGPLNGVRRHPHVLPRTAHRGKVRWGVYVSNLPKGIGWQDLKDFGREAGNVAFTEIDLNNSSLGRMEYSSREDAERAILLLDGRELQGEQVHVSAEPSDPYPSSRPNQSWSSSPPKPRMETYVGGNSSQSQNGGGDNESRRDSLSRSSEVT